MLQVDDRIKVMQKYTVPTTSYYNNYNTGGLGYTQGYKPTTVAASYQKSIWEDDGWVDRYPTANSVKPVSVKTAIEEYEDNLYESYAEILEATVDILKLIKNLRIL
jgi:hypothetical protein